jgi:hypothetical protein
VGLHESRNRVESHEIAVLLHCHIGIKEPRSLSEFKRIATFSQRRKSEGDDPAPYQEQQENRTESLIPLSASNQLMQTPAPSRVEINADGSRPCLRGRLLKKTLVP